MWCLSCLKPSTREDPYETELDLAKAVSSQHEADITSRSRLEEEQYALAIQESLNLAESSRRRQQEEEEKKRLAKELEDDAQVALALQYEDRERERQLDDKSALEAEEIEQLAKAIGESLKEENKRKQIEYEQVKKDEQIAKDLQNFLSEMASEERSRLHGVTVLDDEDKQIAKAVENSLKEENKRKQIEYEQGKKDEQIAKDLQNFLSEMANEERTRPHGETVLDDEDKQIAKAVENSLKEKRKGKQFEYEQGKKDAQESLNKVEPPSQLEENENISTRAPSDEDVQLGEALAKSLKDKGKGKQPKDEGEEDEKLPTVNPPLSMCGGCNFEIEHGKAVDVLGVPWHPECLWCDACHKLIAIHEAEIIVSNSRGKFHKSCYERYCYVCKEKKMKKYNHHPFWEERYCPAHESDGTHKCCSCERLEPKGANYVMLGDRRWLCLECMESAVMDTCEAQPLHFEIREFFEGLHMKIDKEFPFLLVEKQALNKAEKEEKIDYQYETVTRGICLSEAQTVTSVSKRPRMGPNKQLIGMRTESQEVVRECEVTAVLILYGFPRVLTGYILAHEMMHAYLRLSGHRIINNVLEEGICQVLGHMWLESQRYSPVEAEASSSASVSRTPAAACASKKGECSDFEKKLVEFCKNQIETDDSPDYGVGFRKVNEMVSESSLQATLKAIIRKG